MTVVGHVTHLGRFPVKSLGGEHLAEVELDRRGIVADRRWALREPDGKLGSGKSTRRFRAMPGLLELSATLDGDEPEVTFPDGRRMRPGAALDEALAAYVGRLVQLAEEREIPHHDAAPVHLVTDASCREVGAEPASFRANVVIDTHGTDGLVEDAWIGAVLRVGSAGVRLRVTGTTERCVMVGSETLRRVSDRNDLQLGIYAEVLETGVLRTGDEVRLYA